MNGDSSIFSVYTNGDASGLDGNIFDVIPAALTGNASRYVLPNSREGTRFEQVRNLLPDMLSSYTVNIAYHANNPVIGMALEKDARRFKLFTSDVGLFITLAFKEKNIRKMSSIINFFQIKWKLTWVMFTKMLLRRCLQ